eukprot:TRINITY_DN13987_c0_g4_i1.p2 TRINITY_DN13987_c0_g4~~TRINITY_DN13987_c0_g4_i1.p2  ORF type:complete len:152 (+),score=43.59 TRINITY_DN13987_c0_g4_i1:400-855(+)
MIFCILVWIFLKIPHYQGPSKIQSIYSEDDLELEDPQSKVKLVLFYADWSDTCLFTERVWAGLSVKYTNEAVKFYCVDAGVFEKIASKYKVDTNPAARQLPTLLMLENGKETGRYPPLATSNAKSIIANYSERSIVKYLELDAKFYSTSAK